MAADKPGFVSVVRGLAEPSLVLLTGFLLVGLLSLPLLPVTSFEMPLRPVPDAEVLERDLLTREIAELDAVGRADVLLVDGTSRLVLFGVTQIDAVVPKIHEVLVGAGYQTDEFSPRAATDIESIMEADPDFIFSTIAIQTVVLGGLGLALGRRRRVAAPDTAPPFDWPRALIFGLATGGVIFAANVLVSVVQGLLGFPAEEQEWIVRLVQDPDALLRLVPWIVVLVPLSEELVFRYYAMRYIAHHAGFFTAALASSLMFALMHFNPSGFVAYTVIGLLLAYSYQRSGRIAVPILAHVVQNGLALMLTYYFPELV